MDEKFIEDAVAQVNALCEMICNTESFEYSPTPYCKNNCEFYDSCEGVQDTNLMALNSLKEMADGGLAHTSF
ncbi:hypothetical protein Amet_2185 [Alkaliphilus metalliredigens QYMF]|uniref:Uncharacterized protein n=1 Tax=Alkaliphilus metalliredigens (strain QYMF) TaxID=293826 RepID=A6TQ76_ALKMQ|nr:hypothetical protein [Alkaliphilus metalliredigens]ABR48344.1 hypothetical protein Amet_2185 [Alkaliphilus metalliredigens QYMF]